MSQSKDRLLAVANQLMDIASEVEDRERPVEEWKTDGWKTLIENIRSDGMYYWGFDNESHPTEVLHEVFLRLQTETQNARRREAVEMDFGPVPVERIDQVPPARIDWRALNARMELQRNVANIAIGEQELRGIIRAVDEPEQGDLR